VTVTLGKRKGKIVVEFSSVDDLERIVAVMGTPGASRAELARRSAPPDVSSQ